MLREEKDTFLDDMTIEQLGQRLGVKVEVLPVSGGDEGQGPAAQRPAYRPPEKTVILPLL